MNQNASATKFRLLHERNGAFIIPNPWDVGTARILASLGFEALATTSAGMAFALGQRDGDVSKEQILDHCRDIVGATNLPVSADLEQGFGPAPEDVAETIRDAAATGLAGCSIEDYTEQDDKPIFEFDLAVERIIAAVETKRGLSHDFVLTARCENYLRGRPDLDDTIERLQAYENAGADVLYAPGLHDLETIRVICESVTRPVNIVMGMPGASFGVAELADVGVKRISVGSALCRAALGAFVHAAREMHEHGTFTFSSNAIGFAEIEDFFADVE